MIPAILGTRGTEMRTITMTHAVAAYRRGNDAGNGFAPDSDRSGDDSVDSAVSTAVGNGWTVILERRSTSDVVVVQKSDEYVAIGGDWAAMHAWAVDISNEAKS
jgi:hypothetical protein